MGLLSQWLCVFPVHYLILIWTSIWDNLECQKRVEFVGKLKGVISSLCSSLLCSLDNSLRSNPSATLSVTNSVQRFSQQSISPPHIPTQLGGGGSKQSEEQPLSSPFTPSSEIQTGLCISPLSSPFHPLISPHSGVEGGLNNPRSSPSAALSPPQARFKQVCASAPSAVLFTPSYPHTVEWRGV